MTWAVTVERDGEKVVTIDTNCLSGRDISPEDEDAIRTAAEHLLAFIGQPLVLGGAIGTLHKAYRTDDGAPLTVSIVPINPQ